MNHSVKMSSFTDMLNSEFSEYDGSVTPTPNTYISQSLGEEEIVEVSPISPETLSLQKAKDKRQRTKNFSKQEDKMLILAWQNISLDPIAGVDQTNGTYWESVHHYFMKHKNFQSDRSPSSLTHRWSIIQLAVNKFQGFYNQADGKSGFSESDKIQTAKELYKDACKTNFSVEHCWKLLRNSPKWNASFATKKFKTRKESSANSSLSTAECVMSENSEFERPIGRKAAKEMQKKRKRSGNEQDDDCGAAILEKMRSDQLEARKQRNEHLKEMIQLAKEREDREKRREAKEQDEVDAKIMAMDTSSMGPLEVEYFNSRKQEIMERRRTQISR